MLVLRNNNLQLFRHTSRSKGLVKKNSRVTKQYKAVDSKESQIAIQNLNLSFDAVTRAADERDGWRNIDVL